MSPRRSEDKRIYKLKEGDKYLSYPILKAILQDTTVPIKVIEEKNSELFYETLTGKGRVIFSNSLKYFGPVKNGLLETGYQERRDKCIIIFPDGTKYEGDIHSNRITGEGKYYFPSGAKYTGNILNGLRDGYGKYFSPEGVIYEGEWKEGLKHGKGTMKTDAMTYEGNFELGNIHGKGKIKWENGNIFEGEFKENHLNGYGYMIWYDLLEKYIGEWKEDKQNGNGIHIWYEPQGELKEMRNRYVGQWKNGARNGYGVFFYSNGARYEGEWKNNLKNGFGIMLYEDGKKYIGRFEDDRLIDKYNELSEEEVIKLYEDFIINKMKKEKNKDKDKDKINSLNMLELKKKISKGKKGSLFSINSIINNGDSKESMKEMTSGRTSSPDINQKENDKNDTSNTNTNLISSRQKNSKKLIFKFIPIFDLSDLEINYPEIKSDSEEITKVILRNLAAINKLYHYINKLSKLDIINEETGKPNMILTEEQTRQTERNFTKKIPKNLNSSRASFKVSNKKMLAKKSIGSSLIQLNTNLIPKIEEQIKSDDINFCIQLKDFWYYIRDFGLFNDIKISIAEFNHLFNSGKNNFYECFKVPKYLTESDDIYNYLNTKINKSKKDFVLKYKNYLNYYYKDSKESDNNSEIIKILKDNENKNKSKDIKDNNNISIINSVHDERRILLPRFFYESLIRLAFLVNKYSSNNSQINMKLSKRLELLLDIIIPTKFKKKQNSSLRQSTTKADLTLNNSMNVIEGNMTRVIETKTIQEFVDLFVKDLKYIFDKIFLLYKEKNNINFSKNGDKTITHLFLYRSIFSKSAFFRQCIPNVIIYIEIISNFISSKSIYIDNLKKMKKSDSFNIINETLLKEITEWEFNEIIFLICKKNSTSKKLNENDLRYSLGKIKENIDNIIKSSLLKKKYFFPKLKAHIMKEELIEEERKRIEEQRRIKLERERFFNERNNLQKEDVNVYMEVTEEDEEYMEDTDEMFN